MIFVDTGAWYAMFVPDDPDHARVARWFAENRRPLLTTDAVMIELLTLMRARGHRARAIAAGDLLLGKRFGVVHSVAANDFMAAWQVFREFSDKQWSFTDCISYAIFSRLKIETAVSLDHYFRQFGTVAVVPDLQSE